MSATLQAKDRTGDLRDSQGRTRFVRYTYNRDPDGPILEKDKGPIGHRTPNGFIWAHFVPEFVYIPRVPGIPHYVTTWSRSMLKVLDEHYDEVEPMWPDPLVPPRVLRPWPVLRLPLDHPAQTDPPIGAIDEGCEFEHSEFMCYAIRGCIPYGVKPFDSATSVPRIPRRCLTSTSNVCPGRLLPNAGADAVLDCNGRPYDFLWCPHFRALLDGKDDDECTRLRNEAVLEICSPRVLADEIGVQIYLHGYPRHALPTDKWDQWRDYTIPFKRDSLAVQCNLGARA
ncbi:hypothetical protein FKP32DRAFT_1595752 [Trametes sanguinea]|nr:hypothetical protein FKP32DRAFT_1595752 [Trametes sanguinea]